MSEIDKSKYIDILKEDIQTLQQEKEKALAAKDHELERLRQEFEKQSRIAEDTNAKLNKLLKIVSEDREERKKLQADNEALADELEKNRLSSRLRFGSTSQKAKGASSKSKSREEDRSKDKDDFDGTSGSLTSDSSKADESEESGTASSDNDSNSNRKKTPSLNQLQAYQDRLGSSYRTMKADNVKEHLSDMSKLPDGAVFIRKGRKSVYYRQTLITRHDYETLVYKLNGRPYETYFPAEGEPEFVDIVPGTHASSDMMAYLGFNHFSQDVPSYREVDWLLEHGMNVSRQTLSNWLRKGGAHLAKAIEHLKDIALEKDSIINCDETWCRVKVYDEYKKKYIWCLVDKKTGIAIFVFDDGSRSREVLKSILEGRELKALQSDAYNVYMYIDSSLMNMDHLCCMAHARAKFKYASEQGDKDADFFLEQIGKLYAREAIYKKSGYTREQIRASRNGTEALEIIGAIRSKLNYMKADGHPPRGELMEKALNYLDNYWEQLFRYRKDGDYEIDNNIAERSIRPLTRFRKNSLFYGSTWMAETAACFHTMITTCRMQGVSALAYLKKFFREIARGNRDYSRLLPMTIGLPVKKQ